MKWTRKKDRIRKNGHGHEIGDDMDRTNEELCLLIQSGDRQAKTDIYNKNKRFVKKIASQYFGAYGNSLEREDLEQVDIWDCL